jgi:hypothetical protein
MKTKLFSSILIGLFVVTGLFAQDHNKKAPKDKKANKEWNRKIFKNGKDTRFTRHKRKHYRKPGDDR